MSTQTDLIDLVQNESPVPPMYTLTYNLDDEEIFLGLYDSEERAEEAKKFFPSIDIDEFCIKEREINKIYAVREGQRLYHCRRRMHGDINIDLVDPTFPWLEEAGLVNFSNGECGKIRNMGEYFTDVVLWAKDKSEAKRVFMQMLGEG